MKSALSPLLVAAALAVSGGSGCDSGKVTTPDAGTGGRTTASGGRPGTGGRGTGGLSASGGQSTGGADATGGAVATGGANSGGATATGGTNSGGTTATGGTSSGGATMTGGASAGGIATGGATAGAGIGGHAGAGGIGGIGAGGGIGGAGGSCSPDGTTLNTGCASRALNTIIASPTDDAVLACELLGGCQVWRVRVNCFDQALTAGIDVATNKPACVCRPAGSVPSAARTLYVDPDPPVATYLTGAPTGTYQPPACRFRRLREALAATTAVFARVATIHEVSINKHFKDEFKDPVTGANAPAPLIIPPGVELTTYEAGTFGPTRTKIYLFGGDGARVVMTNGSRLAGFALIGATADNPAGGATDSADLLGCSGGTADIFDLAIQGSGTSTAQTAIHVSGTCALTANRVQIFTVAKGVLVDPGATFTGTQIDGVP